MFILCLKKCNSYSLSVDTPESSEVDSCEAPDSIPKGLPRSQSERLLAKVCKEHAQQERELQEKYNDSIFAMLEKVMKSSQRHQLKTLKGIFERETADVKRKLQTRRHGEVSFPANEPALLFCLPSSL